jgi:hypothetical protein
MSSEAYGSESAKPVEVASTIRPQVIEASAPESGISALVSFSYDAFATHATDPDGALVRAVEALLEGYYRRPGLPAKYARELELCVDGRDFIFPRRDRVHGAARDVIEPIVRAYQHRSRALIVFCGPLSVDHPWIDSEIRWWAQERPGAPVYFALTHGANPAADAMNMPRALIERGGGDTDVFFDLRGFYLKRSAFLSNLSETDRRRSLHAEAHAWHSVREFDEEVGKLAARLVSDATNEELSLSELEAAYAVSERAAKRRRRINQGTWATVVVCLMVMLAFGFMSLRETQSRAIINAWQEQAEALAHGGGIDLIKALANSASAVISGDATADNNGANTLMRISQSLLPVELIANSLPGEERPFLKHAPLLESDRYVAMSGLSGLWIVDLTSAKTVAEAKVAGMLNSMLSIAKDRLIAVATSKGLQIYRFDPNAREGPLRMLGTCDGANWISHIAIDEKNNRLLFSSHSLDRRPYRETIRAVPVGEISDEVKCDVTDLREEDSMVIGLVANEDTLVVATNPNGGGRSIAAFDMNGDLAQARWEKRAAYPAVSLAVIRRDKQLVVGGGNPALGKYDLQTGTAIVERPATGRIADLFKRETGAWSRPPSFGSSPRAIAIDPTEAFLAAVGDSGSVEFYLLSDLVSVGTTGSGVLPQAVEFLGRDGVAIVVLEDGSIMRVKLPSMLEVDRFPAVATLTPIPNRPYVGGTPSVRDPIKQIVLQAPDGAGNLDHSRPLVAEIPEGAVRQLEPLRAEDVKALRDGRAAVAVDNRRVFVVGPHWHKAIGIPLEKSTVKPCVIDLLAQDNGGRLNAELRSGARPGELASLAQMGFKGPSTVRLWDSISCSPRVSLNFPVPLDNISLARDTIVTVEGRNNLIVTAVSSGIPVAQITFQEWIGGTAVGADNTILAAERFGRTLCACRKRGAKRNSTTQQDTCQAESATHACFPVSLYERIGDSPEAITMSPSGKLAVATQQKHGRVELGKLENDWRFNLVSSQSFESVSAGEQPAFALSPDEKFLAVPGDGKDVKIIDVNSMKGVAELPTASKVRKIVFLDDGSARIVSLDEIVRIWDWRLNALIGKACERWPANFVIQGGMPPPLSRTTICGTTAGR